MPFDPFDEKHRDKIKRRRPEEVAFDKQQWEDRLLNHFKRVLDEWGWPTFVDTESMLNSMAMNVETNVEIHVLKRAFERCMSRVEYIKLRNEKSKDGRWNFHGTFVFAYAKKGAPKVDKLQLKQELQR